MTSELKERILEAIVCLERDKYFSLGTILCAILADLERTELRRCPKCGNEDEPLQACDHCGHRWYTTSRLDRGVEREDVPKPTVEPDKVKREAAVLIRRYRTETPLGNQPHMIASDADAWLIANDKTPISEPPAQMICNHAGECDLMEKSCNRKTPHKRMSGCSSKEANAHPADCPFPDAVCVPWVEPVKHWTCDGCHHEHSAAESQRCAACRDDNDVNDTGNYYHRFWTPAQSEPAAPEAIRVPGFGYIPKRVEPVVKENFTAEEPKPAVPVETCSTCGDKGCSNHSSRPLMRYIRLSLIKKMGCCEIQGAEGRGGAGE